MDNDSNKISPEIAYLTMHIRICQIKLKAMESSLLKLSPSVYNEYAISVRNEMVLDKTINEDYYNS